MRYAVEFTGLADKAKEKVKTFSGSMKRRLNIACAIAHQPVLLIMDEPTVAIMQPYIKLYKKAER